MDNDLQTKDLEQGLENVFVARVVQHVVTKGDGTRNGCVKIVTNIYYKINHFYKYQKHWLEMIFTTLTLYINHGKPIQTLIPFTGV